MRSILKYCDIVLATFTMMNVILTTLLVPAWGRLLIEPINKTVLRLSSPPLVTTHCYTHIRHESSILKVMTNPLQNVSFNVYAEYINANPRKRFTQQPLLSSFLFTSSTAIAITILRVLITTLLRLPRNEFPSDFGVDGQEIFSAFPHSFSLSTRLTIVKLWLQRTLSRRNFPCVSALEFYREVRAFCFIRLKYSHDIMGHIGDPVNKITKSVAS